jgi:orotidine-5'-phosphate decarboxylase
MISRQQLIQQIRQKKSFLCVGLDTDIEKIPAFLKEYPDPVFEFNKRIIDATRDLCIAYKPNAAFYEKHGVKGLQSLEATCLLIPSTLSMQKEGISAILRICMRKPFLMKPHQV